MMPDFLKRLFWDADVDMMDAELHRAYIIRRIVDYGVPQDILWMKQTYSPKEIQGVIKKSRGISRKSGHYWAAYYSIPEEEIECLKMLYPKKLRPF
ncbi:MAG: hypothetical protein ACE5HY_05045 [Candidatus Hydrothermarchaeales archaeon]